MKTITSSLAFVSLALAMPLTSAAAQTPGMQVVDTSGGAVGSVVSVDGDNVVINTGKHQVALPKASFTAHEGKLLFGMTQAQLNAETEKSLAAAAKIVADIAHERPKHPADCQHVDEVEDQDGVVVGGHSGRAEAVWNNAR